MSINYNLGKKKWVIEAAARNGRSMSNSGGYFRQHDH